MENLTWLDLRERLIARDRRRRIWARVIVAAVLLVAGAVVWFVRS